MLLLRFPILQHLHQVGDFPCSSGVSGVGSRSGTCPVAMPIIDLASWLGSRGVFSWASDKVESAFAQAPLPEPVSVPPPNQGDNCRHGGDATGTLFAASRAALFKLTHYPREGRDQLCAVQANSPKTLWGINLRYRFGIKHIGHTPHRVLSHKADEKRRPGAALRGMRQDDGSCFLYAPVGP